MNKTLLTKNNTTTNQARSIVINSWLVSIMISYNLINVVLDKLVNTSISIGNTVAIFITLGFFISYLLRGNRQIKIRSIIFMLFIFGVLIISFWGLSFYQGTRDIIINFLFLGLVSYGLGSRKINIENVLRNLIYISLFSLITFEELMNVHQTTYGYSRIDMGLSYALIPIVIGAILHFFYYRNKSNIIIKIGYVFNFYLLFKLVVEGTRGGLVTIVFLVLILQTVKFKKIESYNILIRKRKIIFLLTAIISIGLIFYESLFAFVNSSLINIGVRIAFFEKTSQLINLDNGISNGRIFIYKQALMGIKESPIWGNGVGSFHLNTGLGYPHNLILDILYDGGILLLIPIMAIIAITIIKFIKGEILYKEDYIYLTLLISTSIPRLMFSASFWRNQIFWLLIGYAISEVCFNKSHKEVKQTRIDGRI